MICNIFVRQTNISRMTKISVRVYSGPVDRFFSMLRVLLFFALSLLAGVFFWQVATGVNASKYNQEEYRRVQHPDFIPSRASVAVAGAGYDAAIGDRYWLETVQYVGTHAAGGEYKAYLAALLGLVTDIDPRMESAYLLGQKLLPGEPASSAEVDPHLASAIALGKK